MDKDLEYFPAPHCTTKNNKHITEIVEGSPGNVWYERCTECGERFALVSETVLDQLGIMLLERPLKEQ